VLPEAKTNSAWLDADTLFVATDFGPGSMTSSATRDRQDLEARLLRSQRPSRCSKARPATSPRTRCATNTGLRARFRRRLITFYYTNEMFVSPRRPARPDRQAGQREARSSTDLLLLELREDWTIAERTYPAGALIAADFDAFLGGARTLRDPLHADRTQIACRVQRHAQCDPRQRARQCPQPRLCGHAQRRKVDARCVAGAESIRHVSVDAIDADESDDYFMAVTDFITPTRLFPRQGSEPRAGAAQAAARVFRCKALAISQHEAVSKDGTRFPISKSRAGTSRATAGIRRFSTVTAASRFRCFRSTAARSARPGWKRAAQYVLANIRGGGEFGRSGIVAALKANRHKAFEDFIAVAEDLCPAKSPRRRILGIQGGSNGGLLMGNMLTLRPDLFGAVVCQVPLLDMRRYHLLLAERAGIDDTAIPDDPDDVGVHPHVLAVSQRERRGDVSADALHDVDARRSRAIPATRARWRRKMRDMGRTSSTTRTSKAATAGRRTIASTRT
jgi:prolyl oligopeptidase